MYYSELQDWYTNNAFRSFSLKYVVDRCIYYKVGKQEHAVGGNQFLLACKQPHVQAYFHSREKVKSICIDICPATVAEAFSSMQQAQDFSFDNNLAGYFRFPEFFESVSPAAGSILNPVLAELVHSIRTGTASELITSEWFFDLVEKVVCHEYGHFLALNGLSTVKTATRKETLRRLYLARDFMEQNFLTIADIQEVAAVASLSVFHFYRSYRQAFGRSPYQYILQLRLQQALALLAKGMTLSEIALTCHFPDVFSFSKAFKKHYGLSPAHYRRAYLS